MVVVDTNILVRWLTRDSLELSAKADLFFNTAKQSSILLDRIVLAELCYVLKSVYSFKKADIALNLRSLVGDDRFSIPDRSLVELMVKIFGEESQLSPEDSWLLALKDGKKVSAIMTFDKALLKISNK